MKRTAFFFVLLTLIHARVIAAEEFPLKARAMVSAGYDDNALLSSSRKGDVFAQQSVSLGWKRNFGSRVRTRADFDAFNVNYFEVTDQSVLWQAVNPGVDYLVSPTTALQMDYHFDYLYFPRNEIASSRSHGIRAGVLHKIHDALRFKAGAGPAWRQFTDNKINHAGGTRSDEDNRSDDRWIADSELIWNIWSDGVLRPGFSYSRNDSDDQFNDFYDYDSYSFRVSLTAKMTPKIYYYLKFGYENVVYDDRRLVALPDETENSDVYTASASLFYAFRKDISLGLSYTYRQKESNEPSQAYSGSITTVGLYYTF